MTTDNPDRSMHPTSRPPVVHRRLRAAFPTTGPFLTAVCGPDAPEWALTSDPHKVTCPACLAAQVAGYRDHQEKA